MFSCLNKIFSSTIIIPQLCWAIYSVHLSRHLDDQGSQKSPKCIKWTNRLTKSIDLWPILIPFNPLASLDSYLYFWAVLSTQVWATFWRGNPFFIQALIHVWITNTSQLHPIHHKQAAWNQFHFGRIMYDKMLLFS